MKASDQRGSLVLVALGVISVVSIFAFLCVQNIASRHATLRVSANWQRALSIADAGIQSAIAELKHNPDFEGEKDTAFDGGCFTTEVSKLSSGKDTWVVRSRSLFQPSSGRSYRKELVTAIRLSEGKVEVLSREENTPVH